MDFSFWISKRTERRIVRNLYEIKHIQLSADDLLQSLNTIAKIN